MYLLQTIPLTKTLLNKPVNNCGSRVMGIRNKVILRLGFEITQQRSELCAFKLKDMYCVPKGKPIVRLNFSKSTNNPLHR